MGFTQKQQEVIDSRNESLLVSAAAGSGKTSVLVERVIKLLEGGVDLSRMLVVTFTNAAALEMKERIAARLGSSYVKHAHICTFHKFAIDLIQQYYHIIGINPAIKICDDYRQSLLKQNSMDELFEELFNKDDKDFIDFLNCYCSFKDNRNAKEMILQLSAFLESLPNPDEFISNLKNGNTIDAKQFEDFAKSSVLSSLKAVLDALNQTEELLLNPGTSGADPMKSLAAKVEDDIANLTAIYEDIEANGIASFGKLGGFSFTRMTKTNAEKSSFAFIEDQYELLHKSYTEGFKNIKSNFSGLTSELLSSELDAMKKPLKTLANLTESFIDKYNSKKKKENLVDFSDIEHFALKILENEEAREEIKASFDYIFVDEYQDSNLVQDSLIARIAKEDNLFMVGDVKQSIYKFRLAEPELFLSKYQDFKLGKVKKARAIDLNSNFRSKGLVIAFINKLFERIMTKESSGISYDEDASLREGVVYDGDKQYKPELYLCSSKSFEDEELDDEIKELESAEIEALNAVNIIKKYHGKTIYDAKKEVERPLEYKDMVILLRSTKNRGEIFYQALEAAGIPVYLERGEGYFDTPEIQLLVNLLKIIDNFQNDLALISVLAFPVFGFSSKDLADIRIFANEKDKDDMSYSDAFMFYISNANTNLAESCKAFFEKIEYYRVMARSLPLADFIWTLLCESGIGSFAKALPGGAQRYANLKALVDKAASFEEEGMGGLYNFISYIEAISAGDRAVETGQAMILTEGLDAVRIMTIHKSKGLEFPFVLLAGLGSRFNRSVSRERLALHKDFGAAIKLVEPLKGLNYVPNCLKLINTKKEEEEFAETIRVLYVAMTRAKDILVCSAYTKDPSEWLLKSKYMTSASSCSNYLDMIGASFSAVDIIVPSAAELSITKEDKAICKEILDSLDSGFKLKEEDKKISDEELIKRLSFDYSPEESSLKKQKYSVSEIAALSRSEEKDEPAAYNDGPSYAVPSFIGTEAVLNAAAKGTAYHKVMEMFDFKSEDTSPKAVSDLIKDLINRNLLTEAEGGALDPNRISKFFESDIGIRARRAEEIFKEKPFVLKTHFDDREVLVQGTIDCFFEEDGQYVLVDYKSNYIDASHLESEKERLREEYIPQLKLYKEALEKITGKTVKLAVLYLFGINDTIEIC